MSEQHDDLSEILNVATNAAKHAGEIILRGQHDALSTAKEKGSAVDIVTEADQAAEECVVETILKSFPDDGILAEEGSERPSLTGRRWIIDPLDGTANFIREWSLSVVSVGVEIDGEFTVGVVYNPFDNQLFHGITGHGSFLNDERLTIDSRTLPYSAAHVGIEGGYMSWARNQRALVAANLISDAGAIRGLGTTALMMSYVASGRLDAHVNIGSSLWDIAGATVIAREAGYIVEGLKPGSEPTAHHTIAGRPELIAPLRRAVFEAADKYETGMAPSEDAKSSRSHD